MAVCATDTVYETRSGLLLHNRASFVVILNVVFYVGHWKSNVGLTINKLKYTNV